MIFLLRTADRVGLEGSRGKEFVNFIGVSFDLKLRGTFDNMEFGDNFF